MEKFRTAYRALVGRPEGSRPSGRPRRRWKENIAKNRVQLRAYVSAVMKFRVTNWLFISSWISRLVADIAMSLLKSPVKSWCIHCIRTYSKAAVCVWRSSSGDLRWRGCYPWKWMYLVSLLRSSPAFVAGPGDHRRGLPSKQIPGDQRRRFMSSSNSTLW